MCVHLHRNLSSGCLTGIKQKKNTGTHWTHILCCGAVGCLSTIQHHSASTKAALYITNGIDRARKRGLEERRSILLGRFGSKTDRLPPLPLKGPRMGNCCMPGHAGELVPMKFKLQQYDISYSLTAICITDLSFRS